MKKPGRLFSFLISLLSLLAISSSGSAAPTKLPVLDRVAAVVNNDAITESDLNRQINMLMLRIKQNEMTVPPIAQLKKQILDRMVLDRIQLQKATEGGITLEDKDLDKAVADIAKRDNLSVDDLKKFLEDQGVPFTDFRNSIKTELVVTRLQQREVGQGINISTAEIEQFLNSPAGLDQTGAEYQLGHILIELPEAASEEAVNTAKSQADQILQRLRKGANFHETAMSTSSGAQALNGGDLGWRKAVEIPTVFAKVTQTLKVGEVHGLIQDSSGFHIIKLLDKRIDGVKTTASTVKKYHVRHIVLKPSEKFSEKEAETLLNTVHRSLTQENADFPKLALKHSHEISTASKGGDLGWVTPTSVVPEFYKKLGELQPNQISEPFKTSQGWHIVQLLAVRNELAPSQAMRDRANEILFQRKMEERLVNWLRRARDEAQVAIYLNET